MTDIIGLQRRVAEVGRLRIGQQVPTQSGKTRPAKLDTWRVTSPDKTKIEAVAQLYGGTPRPWLTQWEVITAATELPVIVPPTAMSFSQYYEMWSAGGCIRRCDEAFETISQGPCLCDPTARECDIHTRLSVFLRDVPGLGVYRLDTQGFYAASELSAAVQIIRVAASRGQMLPARLRLDQRTVKRHDQPTRHFVVPVLDINITPGALILGELAAGPAEAPELSALPALPSVDEAQAAQPPAAPPQDRAQKPPPQSRAQKQPAKKAPPRTAPALPPTDLAPRTAAEYSAAKHSPVGRTEAPISDGQRRFLFALLGRHGLANDRDRALAACSALLGRNVESTSDLTVAQASLLIDDLQKIDDAFLRHGIKQMDERRKAAEQILNTDLDSHITISHAQANGLVDLLDRIPAAVRESFDDFIEALAVTVLSAITQDEGDDRDPETGELIPPSVGARR